MNIMRKEADNIFAFLGNNETILQTELGPVAPVIVPTPENKLRGVLTKGS